MQCLQLGTSTPPVTTIKAYQTVAMSMAIKYMTCLVFINNKLISTGYLKPGTHWQQSCIQHGPLCGKSTKSTVSATKLNVSATMLKLHEY